jgi:hypothetical protein
MDAFLDALQQAVTGRSQEGCIRHKEEETQRIGRPPLLPSFIKLGRWHVRWSDQSIFSRDFDKTHGEDPYPQWKVNVGAYLQ